MNRFFEKVAQHLDKLDAESVRGQYKGLAQEFAFLESVFRALGEGVLVTSAEGLLAYANPAAERLANFDFAANKGKALSDILPTWDWADLLTPAAEATWLRACSREITLTYPERRILEVQAMPEDTVTILIIRDVTQKHAHEKDILESERTEAIQHLASGVAHEIGNPLNALSLNLDLLARALRKEPALQNRERLLADVETAKREVKRIDAINRSFLNALRPVKPHLVPGSVTDPLKATLAEFKSRFSDRAITVCVDLPSALPNILMDADQLQQVFFNLIKNALEAMKDGGTLALALTVTDEQVEISFRDTGTGIAPHDLVHLFEPYHTTKGVAGNGLGLMVCQRIVRAHGGDIDVSSRAGEGTCFTVRLPRLEKRVRRLT